MKISKLFHWLYAFLMFLPIVLFIPNAFYYGFNEHATNTETTTINYKYQSNEVYSVDDLVVGNIYHLDVFEYDYDSFKYDEIEVFIVNIEDITINSQTGSYIDETYVSNYTNKDDNEICLWHEGGGSELFLRYTNSNAFVSYAHENCVITFTNFDFYIIYNLNVFKQICTTLQILPQYTNYNIIESVDINTNDTISNKMYQAWQSTWNLPLLQWTHNSFVAAPFTYITGLFGVPFDSTLNYIFAYFVSISICWLVFDLIMYVPNLAHRWLDKGALE